MPRTRHTSTTLHFSFIHMRSAHGVRKISEWRRYICLFDRLHTSVCFNSRTATGFDAISYERHALGGHSKFAIFYDRSLGVPARILATIPTELSQQVPLKRWDISTIHRTSQLPPSEPQISRDFLL
jgi:hypothetical protein